MKLKTWFQVQDFSLCGNLSLLFLRFVAGLAFMFHGWGKIQDPFNWMGEEAFAPGILQALAALSEFGGGLCWILGLLMPLASFGMACTMAVATYLHAVMMGDPFVASAQGGGSYELAALYFALSLVFIGIGPGSLSLDRAIFGKRPTASAPIE